MHRYIITIVTLMLSLLGCGGGSASETSAQGGQGGATSTFVHADGEPCPVIVGNDECRDYAKADAYFESDVCVQHTPPIVGCESIFAPPDVCSIPEPIAPFDAANDQALFPDLPLVDEDGAPLEEDGALACKRIIPPSTPYAFTRWDVDFADISFCSLKPDVVVFVAPTDATWPITVGAANQYALTVLGPNDTAPLPLDINITVTDASDAFYACERLPIGQNGQRACAGGCKHNDGSKATNQLYSATHQGKVDPLPVVDLEVLGGSPTQAIAEHFKSWTYEFNVIVYGHPL
jgi:hypothetical protein